MRHTWGPWVLDTYMSDLNMSERLVSWLCLCTIWITIIYIDYQVCDLFVKLFVDYKVILNDPWSILLCETRRLTYVLIDDHVSQGIKLIIWTHARNMVLNRSTLKHCYDCYFCICHQLISSGTLARSLDLRSSMFLTMYSCAL
jgi:hypothetical protein